MVLLYIQAVSDCWMEDISDFIGAPASERNKNLFILFPLKTTTTKNQTNKKKIKEKKRKSTPPNNVLSY